jgi:hypothetical protein
MSILPLVDHATGQRLAPEDATQYTVIAAGFPEVEGAMLFTSEEAFYTWGKRSRYAKAIAEHRRKLDQLRGLTESERSSHLAHRTEVQRRIQDILVSLSESETLPLDSEELVQVAIHKPEIRELTTDPITLYRGEGFTQRHYTLWGDHPDFRDIEFNNITSSCKMFVNPLGTLFANRWYEGRHFVMLGIFFPVPFIEVSKLSDVGFDNVASSYMQVAVFP